MSGCPGRLALCGVPCGCEGKNRSHYPADFSRDEPGRHDGAVSERYRPKARAPR